MSDEMALVRALLANRASEDTPWAERRAQMDALADRAPLPGSWMVEPLSLGRPAERHSGPGLDGSKAIFYLHGGGYCIGSPRSHRPLVAQLAAAAGVEGYALDYRLGPEHPFPGALDDAIAGYRALLHRGVGAERVVIAGDSAGGGLSLALVQALAGEGLPQPAGMLLISPWLNLAQEGESYRPAIADQDPMLTKAGLDQYAAAYLAELSPRDPRVSPLFGALGGLPPTLVQVGDAEILLSDSEALRGKPGVEVQVWPGMIHVWHAFFPILTPARAAIAEAGAWIAQRLK